jgi:hypothetical protein
MTDVNVTYLRDDTTEPKDKMSLKHEPKSSAKGWWNQRFRMQWPEDKDPSWHVDLILAHKIIAPILYENKQNIDLWRFHRMAARSLWGHQFSFNFYTTPETAHIICNSIKTNRLLKELLRSGIITEVLYECSDAVGAPNIEDSGDASWSFPIKKSWPYFITGVCEMWLKLIDEIAQNQSSGRTIKSLPKIITFYQGVNDAVKKTWREEGGHSLFHHLNAIFGYEPVLVHEVQLRRF